VKQRRKSAVKQIGRACSRGDNLSIRNEFRIFIRRGWGETNI